MSGNEPGTQGRSTPISNGVSQESNQSNEGIHQQQSRPLRGEAGFNLKFKNNLLF